MGDALTRLTDSDFVRFRDYFYGRTGIYFDESKRYFVDKRLIERIKACGFNDFRNYFAMMRFQAGEQEFQKLVNVMTVNETYFMREAYQFDCLVENVLDECMADRNRQGPLRIWSIPSSTGEEAYSMALTLLDRWPHIDHVDVEIIASDIDTAALEVARRGIYKKRSLQYLSDGAKQRYFQSVGPDRWQVADTIRDAISFTHVNLADPAQTERYRDFDIVFCRNLLIYFDEASRRQAAGVLHEALRPGGFIFLGHSESMSRMSTAFQIRKFPKAMAYQKPLRPGPGQSAATVQP
ncbi:protein-glutamate O-methyltransferase CheR [Salinisphaera sp. Q1T1-3]|nr:protein-glutamate O-methyltransferase CheR [Salinisphaera sp. Q1T1-3]